MLGTTIQPEILSAWFRLITMRVRPGGTPTADGLLSLAPHEHRLSHCEILKAL